MKHVLITGCSRGIGLSTAEKLLSDSFRVTGTNRKTAVPDSLSKSPHFKSLTVDLGKSSGLNKTLQPLFTSDLPDVLINNAGMFKDADFSVSDEEWLDVWDETMRVNLVSAALLSKWFVNAHLEKETKGIIINVASRAAYRGDTQEYAAYAASKAGMAAFTKSLARGYSKKGVVAFTVAPGFIETDMARDSIEVLGKVALTQGSAFDEITRPEEVANLISWLAKGEALHMTGSTFHINGGSYMV
jgi:3-oxoacyl-[acyl-carrier protein] reductase